MPISRDEILNCLQTYLDDALAEGAVDDMRPLLLGDAISAVKTVWASRVDDVLEIGDLLRAAREERRAR